MTQPITIVMPMHTVELFNREPPFDTHPEFFDSVREHHEFGFHHPQIGWIKTLVSDYIPADATFTQASTGD